MSDHSFSEVALTTLSQYHASLWWCSVQLHHHHQCTLNTST